MQFNHISVLLNETIESLSIKPNGIYIDGTAGGAGHSKEIAKQLKNVDCDVNAKQTGQKTVAEFAKVIGQDEKLKQLLKE